MALTVTVEPPSSTLTSAFPMPPEAEKTRASLVGSLIWGSPKVNRIWVLAWAGAFMSVVMVADQFLS